jgi:hypothetical protein
VQSMNRLVAIKCIVASLMGFAGGFFIIYGFFNYDHEAGIWFPFAIGIWVTLLVVGFVLRGGFL